MVQPSLYEGFGLTVVEAMATRLPVLVSNIEGPMEIIENGNYGYYFEKGDSEMCAEKILLLMNQSSSYTFKEKMVDNAAFVRLKYNVKNTSRLYIENYKIAKN